MRGTIEAAELLSCSLSTAGGHPSCPASCLYGKGQPEGPLR